MRIAESAIYYRQEVCSRKTRLSTLPGLHDRALVGLMVYSFARVGAAIGTRLEDVHVQGRRTG